jgi:hypothetical protein
VIYLGAILMNKRSRDIVGKVPTLVKRHTCKYFMHGQKLNIKASYITILSICLYS